MNDSKPEFGWKPGDPLTADNLNRNIAADNITVGAGLTLQRVGRRLVIGLAQLQKPSRLSVFPVRVQQTGGEAGTSVQACSYTYTVADIAGTTLGTAVSMTGNGQRVVNAAMTAGTYGQAYYDQSNQLKLIWVDERISQTNC